MRFRSAAVFAACSLLLPIVASAQPYAVARSLSLPGDERWDYLVLDATGARLFVSRAAYVQVMDTASGSLLGTIPDTDGVHGIALAADLGLGFTSDGKANAVTVFDLGSLKTVATVKVDGSKPDAIVYDAFSHHVLTFNGDSDNATVIDPATRAVVGSIPLPGNPEFAVSDGVGRVFVNIEDKADLVAIDPMTMKAVATWPLTGCESPSGLALDAAHHRSFSVCENHKMVVLDTTNGHLVATLPIGAGPDAAAFDVKRGLAFSSNGDGTLTVVREASPGRFKVLATVKTQPSARTMALDPASGRIFLSAATMPLLSIPGQRPSPTPGSFRIVQVDPAPSKP